MRKKGWSFGILIFFNWISESPYFIEKNKNRLYLEIDSFYRGEVNGRIKKKFCITYGNETIRNLLISGVIFYDVLHYLKKVERKKLYSEIHRVLKKDGFLSIYPKHVIEDSP
jgi:chemotaxis methyl-accepting protein methylase